MSRQQTSPADQAAVVRSRDVGASGPDVAARIERDLTRAILRGDHRPGSRLPTLRELATASR